MWSRRFIFPTSQQPYYYHQQPQIRSKSSSSASNNSDPFEYCVNLVRQRDHENYVCSLLLPTESRLSVFAIRAFNVELSSVRFMVTKSNTALMRYQFWQSCLEKIFSKSTSIPEHPVAQALAKSISNKTLSRKWLSELIQARIDRIDDRKNYQTLQELEDHYQRTVGSVLFLMLESYQIRNHHAEQAASHLSKALGLINGLRAINSDPERNYNLLPLELLVRHRTSHHDLVRFATTQRRDRIPGDNGNVTKKIRALIFDVANQADVYLKNARKLRLDNFEKASDGSKVGKRAFNETKLIFLPAAIVDHYLNVLRKVDFDILNPKIGSSYDRLALTIWWRKITGSF